MLPLNVSNRSFIYFLIYSAYVMHIISCLFQVMKYRSAINYYFLKVIYIKQKHIVNSVFLEVLHTIGL